MFEEVVVFLVCAIFKWYVALLNQSRLVGLLLSFLRTVWI